MDAAILAVLILPNGALSMSEIAVISARSGLLQAQADENAGAAMAIRLKHYPTAFLPTVQAGITCIGILNGIVGEAVCAAARRMAERPRGGCRCSARIQYRVGGGADHLPHHRVRRACTKATGPTQRIMVRNLFRLDDRQIGSLMVPRRDVVFLDANLPWPENAKRIHAAEHTRYPVVRGGMRNILGVLSARQILTRALRGEAPNLERELQPPVYVPESVTCMELPQSFRASNVQLAFVIDEYGEAQTADAAEWQGWRFEVVDMGGQARRQGACNAPSGRAFGGQRLNCEFMAIPS